MQVVGPISVLPGVSVTQPDPAKFTAANVACQVLNYSGLFLTGTLGGQPFSIPPFTATTLRFFGNGSLFFTPSSTVSTATGSVTLLWLLAGDHSSIADGPLSAFAVSSKSLTVTGGGTGTLTITGVGPSDISMVIYTNVVNGTGSQQVTVVGKVTGITYLTTSVATDVNVNINTPINGQADNSYTVSVGPQPVVVVTSSTTIAVSNDGGATWAAKTPGLGVAINTVKYSVAINGNNVVLVPAGGSAALYSGDGGVTWATSALPASGSWIVANNGSTFMAVQSGAASTTAAVSTDNGATWTLVTLPSGQAWYVIAGGGSGFVAFASLSTTGIYSTTMGASFATCTVANSTASISVAYSGGTWVYSPYTGNTAESVNGGATWTVAGAQASVSGTICSLCSGVVSGVTTFVMSSGASTGSSTSSYTTNNAATWTVVYGVPSANWSQVAYTTLGFVMVAIGAINVAKSATGASWSTAGNLPVANGYAIASAGAAYFISSTAASSVN